MENETNLYSKRPMWQWVIIYLVLAAIVYGLAYYFYLSKTAVAPTIPVNTTTTVVQPVVVPIIVPGATSPAAPVGQSVNIQNLTLTPVSLTVKVGTTVTWTNNDNVGHTVTSDTGSLLHSPLIGTGQSFSFTFTTAGTYTYHCTVHPTIKGSVTVTP